MTAPARHVATPDADTVANALRRLSLDVKVGVLAGGRLMVRDDRPESPLRALDVAPGRWRTLPVERVRALYNLGAEAT